MADLPYRYRYAGRLLRSCMPLPELHPAEETATGDDGIRIVPDDACPLPPATAAWSHDFLDPAGFVTLTCERFDGMYRMRFPGVATITASHDGDVRIAPEADDCPESIRHVLLDQALPRLLAQRGELLLHAAMVRTRPGKTLLLIGDSGRGKSTLTAAFTASGREVFTDDGALVSVAGGRLSATPTYPSLRLLPDSLAQLFEDGEARTLPVAHYSNKRRLPLAVASQPDEVDAIVLLAPPADGAVPRLVRKTPGAACLAMMQHGFQLDMSDMANVRTLLAKASAAAQLVPVHRLEYPRRYDALPEVIALLESACSGHG